MRLALIADVHSNLEALTAVLADIDHRGADAIYCLGDLVGYGADPGACLDLIRARCAGVVRGNHDTAVSTGEGLGLLPSAGQSAARHNRAQLTDAQLAYLSALPLTLTAHGCTFVHATPQAPDAWLRMDESVLLARAQFEHFDTPVCFIGHSHQPGLIADKLGVLRVKPGHRYVINVGSVGQPRDGNPRACVAYFEPETFTYNLVRVPYDVETAAQKIREAQLPASLADRLRRGR